jgi:hypothetical protein
MSRTRKILATALVIGLLGLIAGVATYSAFSSTATNPGDEFKAGTVVLSDNSSGSSAISLTNAAPGSSTTGCINVSYTGSLAAAVKLYGTVTGSLAQYLNLTVTRGTDSSPSFPSCSNFTADATNYLGLGAGVLYNGALNSYPASYATGIDDASAQTWNQSDSHSYKLQVTLPSSASTAAQGLSASATFTWETRNQ